MSKQRILVVDDEEIVRYSLVNILSAQGYEAEGVASAEEALSRLYTKDYNLVLTDLLMEGMDGLELLENIKVITPRTMVIVITGYGSIKTAVQALRLGVYDYLLKPCDEEELLLRIGRALEMQLYGDQQKRSQEANAITKTTVTLSDQINTPLNIILGNIELLQLTPELEQVPKIQNVLNTMEAQIFKVRDVMRKLASLDNAETRKYTSLENFEMIDLNGTDQ